MSTAPSSRATQLHPTLDQILTDQGLSTDMPPSIDEWQRLLAVLDDRCRRHDIDHAAPVDTRARSSFENLFRHTPVPLIEQDYSELQLWMRELRRLGVEDLRTHLGNDIEAIRALAPKIRMVAANPAAVLAVGIPHHELIGPVDPVIINEGSIEGWITQFEAVWNEIPVVHSSIEASTATGETYDAETILAAPMIDGRPDFSRAVFTIFDVSDHRNEERRMIGLMEAKTRFLASVSHEIRTPLTAVVGFAQLLEEQIDVLDHDDRRLMISAIAQHSHEVANLLEDLLVAARVEIGQIEVSAIPVDLGKQVESVVMGGVLSIDVAVEFGPDTFVKGDPMRIRQIIRNLLTNAERYGGADVRVATLRQGRTTVLEISDNGPGLPVSDWERIFEPYHKAHRRTGQPEAVGIGLTLSRQLAQLMNGSLDYRFENARSIFRLTLPSA